MNFVSHFHKYNHEVYDKCFDARQSSAGYCHLPVAANFFRRYYLTKLESSDFECYDQVDMDSFDPSALNTLKHVWHVLLTMLPLPFLAVYARAILQKAFTISKLRFASEFLIIVVPVIVSVNVANDYVGYFVGISTLIIALFTWRTRCCEIARERQFHVGTRPTLFTLVRSTIACITVICILAIDFDSFPHDFRKTRRYGAALMDSGIGFFVGSMALVSKRLRRLSDLRRLFVVVLPLLFLSIARTVVIMAIDYGQDEHEYGKHLNAFFTLGMAKLVGVLFSFIARNDILLLPLSGVVIALHESSLQFGIAEFVMNNYLPRDTFLRANREGLCSLPGFVAIFICSMSYAAWLKSKSTLSYSEMCRKLRTMLLLSILTWLLTVLCIFTVGIARVTCNAGYFCWIMALMQTLCTLYFFFFDFLLNTVMPIDHNGSSAAVIKAGGEDGELLLKPSDPVNAVQQESGAPAILEAVNNNGLLFFLLANVLTGGVNIFLNPGKRTDFEGVLILCVYMLISLGFIHVLYRKKIRIG